MTVHPGTNYPPVPMAVQRFDGDLLFDAKDTRSYSVEQSNSVTGPEILFPKVIMDFRKLRSPGVTDLP
jgi:hypothetical protein